MNLNSIESRVVGGKRRRSGYFTLHIGRFSRPRSIVEVESRTRALSRKSASERNGEMARMSRGRVPYVRMRARSNHAEARIGRSIVRSLPIFPARRFQATVVASDRSCETRRDTNTIVHVHTIGAWNVRFYYFLRYSKSDAINRDLSLYYYRAALSAS